MLDSRTIYVPVSLKATLPKGTQGISKTVLVPLPAHTSVSDSLRYIINTTVHELEMEFIRRGFVPDSDGKTTFLVQSLRLPEGLGEFEYTIYLSNHKLNYSAGVREYNHRTTVDDMYMVSGDNEHKTLGELWDQYRWAQ